MNWNSFLVFVSRYKKSVFFCAILVFLFLLLEASPTPADEARGWGQTKETIEYGGAVWTGIYYDINGLHFTASMPGVLKEIYDNDNLTFTSSGRGSTCFIKTSFNPDYQPSDSLEQLIEMLQRNQEASSITVLDAKRYGAKYVVEQSFPGPKQQFFIRLIVAGNRIIWMMVIESDAKLRLRFFESFRVH